MGYTVFHPFTVHLTLTNLPSLPTSTPLSSIPTLSVLLPIHLRQSLIIEQASISPPTSLAQPSPCSCYRTNPTTNLNLFLSFTTPTDLNLFLSFTTPTNLSHSFPTTNLFPPSSPISPIPSPLPTSPILSPQPTSPIPSPQPTSPIPSPPTSPIPSSPPPKASHPHSFITTSSYPRPFTKSYHHPFTTTTR
ncbi:hypothetical protein Pmani_009499 [Petrolisthes manimaculis]|uniref:Uncharacterized protein n=1 Tax=Petrolisthes manimaculis TaxID=1843537 RepID=A0AAE1Q3C8_9EUCA|nr:hypothetical protein Pmani_009499 [Petrolisthes manimaculis]